MLSLERHLLTQGSRAVLYVSFRIAACLLAACAAPHNANGHLGWARSQNHCRELETKWESLKTTIKGNSVSDRIAKIREVSSQIADDPEDCVTHLIDEALKNELRKVVVLKIGTNRYEAAAIYTCRELQDGVRCAGRIADDTAHLSEAPDLKATPSGVKAHLTTPTDFTLNMVNVYSALDSDLIDNARKSSHYVELKPDGEFQLPRADRSNILFVIAQDKYRIFHKWVWVLR